MRAANTLNGGAYTVKKYQVSADVSNVGIPLLAVAAGEAGLNIPSTTAINDMVGINLDLATYLTAQQSDGSSPEALVSVIINPDLILAIDLSGGATAGTALDDRPVTSAAADGLSVTTGDDWSSPTTDEGAIWFIDGANVGQIRKITSVSSSAATVTVAFQNDTVVGDNVNFAPFWPMANQTVTLTSDFTEINGAAAVATDTAELQCIELNPNTFLGSAKRAFALFMAQDHILNRES